MKTANLATIGLGVMSAAHLAVLLLWLDAFEVWQTSTLLMGAMLFGVLALTNVKR